MGAADLRAAAGGNADNRSITKFGILPAHFIREYYFQHLPVIQSFPDAYIAERQYPFEESLHVGGTKTRQRCGGLRVKPGNLGEKLLLLRLRFFCQVNGGGDFSIGTVYVQIPVFGQN